MKSLYKTTGIYAIQNKITGMAYVGQTANNFGDRRDSNFAKLRHNKHDNVGLQEDWNKYGEQNYEFRILETLEDCVNIDDREKYWVSIYKKDGKAFNMADGGKGCPGVPIKEEVKRIIGEKNRQHNLGKKASEETKLKMSLSHKGYKPSLEAIEKSRLKHIGMKHTLEAKKKMSIANSGEKCRLAKYTKEQVLLAREIYDDGCRDYKYISEKTGISRVALPYIVKRKRWKYI